jgi:Fuc2NAc and GlcNAc transferase
MLYLIYASLFLVSFVATYGIRVFAEKKQILDIPNDRSSHSVPTPRGGGIAIILAFYLGLLYFHNAVESKLFWALFTALPIVLVSLLDDIVTLSFKVRLVVQAISAVAALLLLGGVDRIDFVLFELQGVWVNALAFVSILWLTNLYNFLDGIDGYAGSEALFVGLGMYLLFHNPLGMILAVASLGFLIFNWQKASIFMGDAGSATLGFLFAVFVFSDTSNGTIYTWLVLLSVFWFDATYTLIKRYRNGESVTQAHKKHLYQRLVQSGWSHQKVVVGALLVNALMLTGLWYYSNMAVFAMDMMLMVSIVWYINRRRSFDDHSRP